ncbi:MAG: hypothetical protein EBT00_14165 [Proteobacteria bacterium]|nr:hypothetical protein [Pseudomonadota bacterium]NBT19892.1 hypothetical protein [Pseudomonadota bacterium]
MAQLETKTISFHQVTSSYPTRYEIKAGVYALSKMSGDWVKIPRDSVYINPSLYSVYAPVSAFPSVVSSPYGEKYADLVKAKDILKNDRYGYNSYDIGKAIGLIKRFLEKNAKV